MEGGGGVVVIICGSFLTLEMEGEVYRGVQPSVQCVLALMYISENLVDYCTIKNACILQRVYVSMLFQK